MMFDVYKYRDLNKCLNALFKYKKRKNSRYSIRAWAKQLGYQSAAFLGQVLKKQRSANLQLLERIKETEDFNDDQWRHLRILFLKSIYNQDDPIFDELLSTPKFKAIHKTILKKSPLLSRWFGPVIFELNRFIDLSKKTNLIQKALSFKVSDKDLQVMTQSLKEDDLIHEHAKQVGMITLGSLIQDDDFLSEEQRLDYHTSLIEIMQKSLQEQSDDEKSFFSSTLVLDQEGIKKITEVIQKTNIRVLNLSSIDKKQAKVYQYHLSLFKVADL